MSVNNDQPNVAGVEGDEPRAASYASNMFRMEMPKVLMKRPGFGTLGRAYKVTLNSHTVNAWPKMDVYQYDVVIGSGKEKRKLIQLLWESKAVQDKIGQFWLFDGNKLAWSGRNLPNELKIEVDMDKEMGRNPRKKDGIVVADIHAVRIRKTTHIRLDTLRSFLDGTLLEFDDSIYSAINFLDHLLREHPSKHLINLRRSYFQQPEEFKGDIRPLFTGIGNGVEAWRGVYQSLRMAEGKKLVVNVDVSNATFWKAMPLHTLSMELIGELNPVVFEGKLRKRNANDPDPKAWKILKRFVKCHFHIRRPGTGKDPKTKIIFRILNESAETYRFDWVNRETGQTKNVSIVQYMLEKYKHRLTYSYLPLVEVRAKELYPMELCEMAYGQQYKTKLNENQTSNMIKFAATRPAKRLEGIREGLGHLKWDQDPFLMKYGLKIDREMTRSDARVLDPPEVQYAKNTTAKPGYTGRWDLRGKVFLKPNPIPLQSWGVCVLTGTGVEGGDTRNVPSMDQTKAFIQMFIKTYRGHGGIVDNAQPPIIGGVPDIAKAIEGCFYAAGNAAKKRPQIMFVVVSNIDKNVYERVKKNLDCKWGIVSQCVTGQNVKKNSPQYHSNVSMKFHCKLGGTVSMAKGKKPYFEVPTMILGADVSHAGAGMVQPSFAAMTMSMDMTASRYTAAVESNGYRQEMISPKNINSFLLPQIQRWMENVGGGRMPKHVYYFRDGVSEAQYIPLLENEVADIKQAFYEKCNNEKKYMPKFTVVVCEKRHHIRFFPPQGPGSDKNGNPVPGTLVERDVTRPFEYDMYLNSHSAIQGTARPTHYQVLLDDAKVPVNQLHQLLYEHCYQYQRSTTPVSLFPAVYYAHLAAARAVSHVNITEQDRWIQRNESAKRPGMPQIDYQARPGETLSEPPALLPMEPTNQIHFAMWYI
ncbi:uncharacterized protein KY384_005818 [Bacidia gigantensis]|uniref:uncharacterized protein n=1 Tax=Bacidia gigantensis TaxID=2732470 RepID=UPI001D0401E1|nr:uncharacterized protein KY384_005818 [Bacidia gigantensis]KAG8529183.1 hypothetical protein KY384_005818 [Bacidia gigantensis]